jgi:dTDP-glucose 4,6-dehydratase
VAEYFATKDNHVIVLDNLSDGSHPELLEKWANNKNLDVARLDTNDLPVADWQNEQNFNYIIHAAAESNVDKSIDNQYAFLHSNINGTVAVLDYARTQPNLKKFLYVNTDEVYGSTTTWRTPKDAPNPGNPYSASKAAAGHFCWAYQNTYGLPIQEIRMCNIIGQRQATTKILPRVIHRIKYNEPMPIYDGGEQTREYMDVRNVAPLVEKVLEDGRETIFNLTFNQEISILELVKEVEQALGKQADKRPATRPGHDKHYRMTPSDVMFNEVGHKLPYIKLKDTIMWMLENTRDTKV